MWKNILGCSWLWHISTKFGASLGIRKSCASRKMKIWLRSIFQKKDQQIIIDSEKTWCGSFNKYTHIIYLNGGKSRWSISWVFQIDMILSNSVFKVKDYSPPQKTAFCPFSTWVPMQGRCCQGQVGLEYYHHKRRQNPSPEDFGGEAGMPKSQAFGTM